MILGDKILRYPKAETFFWRRLGDRHFSCNELESSNWKYTQVHVIRFKHDTKRHLFSNPSQTPRPQDPSLLETRMRHLRLSRGWSRAMSFFKRYEVVSRPTFFVASETQEAHCWAPRVRRFFGKRQVDGWFLTWISMWIMCTFTQWNEWTEVRNNKLYLEIFIYPIFLKFQDPTSRQTGIPCFCFSFGQIFSSWRPSGNTENTPFATESDESCCGNIGSMQSYPIWTEFRTDKVWGLPHLGFFLLWKKPHAARVVSCWKQRVVFLSGEMRKNG